MRVSLREPPDAIEYSPSIRPPRVFSTSSQNIYGRVACCHITGIVQRLCPTSIPFGREARYLQGFPRQGPIDVVEGDEVCAADDLVAKGLGAQRRTNIAAGNSAPMTCFAIEV